MANEELIPRIKTAISERKKQEAAMTAEMANVIPSIQKAKYISANIVHLIEHQYNEKISNVQHEISDMEAHVKELEAQNA